MRMKRFSVICIIVLFALSLSGCANMQVKIGEQGKAAIAEEAGFELGLYFGKKNAEMIPTLYDAAKAMETAIPGTAPDVTALLRSYISKQCTDDPIGQARMERVLGLIEVDIATPAEQDERLAEAVRYLKAAGKGLKQALDIITGK